MMLSLYFNQAHTCEAALEVMGVVSEIFSCCPNIFDCKKLKAEEYVLFVGNPGVGKSTLINSLVGKEVTASGISAGTGLTKSFQHCLHEGRLYIDTPGLADTKISNLSAREIEKALKLNGPYRIFFVITLNAGKVRDEDIKTINKVMNAINQKGKSFNVIVNQITTKERHLLQDASARKVIIDQINSGRHKTQSIIFVGRDRDLDDELTQFLTISEELNQFIYQDSHCFFLDNRNVFPVGVQNLDLVKRKMARDKALAQQQIKDQEKKEAAARKELSNRERTVRIFQEEERRRREEAAQQLKQLQEQMRQAQAQIIEEQQRRDKFERKEAIVKSIKWRLMEIGENAKLEAEYFTAEYKWKPPETVTWKSVIDILGRALIASENTKEKIRQLVSETADKLFEIEKGLSSGETKSIESFINADRKKDKLKVELMEKICLDEEIMGGFLKHILLNLHTEYLVGGNVGV